MKIRARYLHIIESVANVIVGYLINLLLVIISSSVTSILNIT